MRASVVLRDHFDVSVLMAAGRRRWRTSRICASSARCIC